MSPRLAIVAEPAAGGLAGLDGRSNGARRPPRRPERRQPVPTWWWLSRAPTSPGVSPTCAGHVRWSAGARRRGTRSAGGSSPRPATASGAARAVGGPRRGLRHRAAQSRGRAAGGHRGRGARRAPAREARNARDARSHRALADRRRPGRAAIGRLPAGARAGGPVPGAHLDAAPAAAFAVLAARRLLISPRARLTFGLLPGVDHVVAGTDDEVVQYADAFHAFPESFALPGRAWPHRRGAPARIDHLRPARGRPPGRRRRGVTHSRCG